MAHAFVSDTHPRIEEHIHLSRPQHRRLNRINVSIVTAEPPFSLEHISNVVP